MPNEKHYLPLSSTTHLVKTMRRYFIATRYHHIWGTPLKRPLAWITSGAPVEILRALSIDPVYPENFGAICGARKVGAKLCKVAEDAGYSQDLCSYARAGIGAILRPDMAPMGGLPRPDLLLACTNICGTVLKWYEMLSRHFGIPLFLIDTPFVGGELEEHSTTYVVKQMERLIKELEQFTGRSLKRQRLYHHLDLSNEAVRLWTDIRDLCRNRPSPLNAPDLFTHMAPIVVLRGTGDAVAYYRRLYAEVRERVQNGQAAVSGERHRLLWDNIAIWHQMFSFYRLFSERGACFVTDTYTGGWTGLAGDGDDPMESMARSYISPFLNRSVDFRTRQMVNMIRDFAVDGFVMHSNRSCKPQSLVQEEIRRRVMNETGVPGVLVEADMTDSRAYAEEPVRNRVQAFIESLEMRR